MTKQRTTPPWGGSLKSKPTWWLLAIMSVFYWWTEFGRQKHACTHSKTPREDRDRKQYCRHRRPPGSQSSTDWHRRSQGHPSRPRRTSETGISLTVFSDAEKSRHKRHSTRNRHPFLCLMLDTNPAELSNPSFQSHQRCLPVHDHRSNRPRQG